MEIERDPVLSILYGRSLRNSYWNYLFGASCTTGFFGEVHSTNYRIFLGQTVLNLTDDMKNLAFTPFNSIFLQEKLPSFTTSKRLLNQFSAVDADKNWAIHSYSFALKSFYPINPLRLAGHTSGVRNRSSDVHILASMVLRCFPFRSIAKEEVTRALGIVVKNKSLYSLTEDFSFNALVKDAHFNKLHLYEQTVLTLWEKLEAIATNKKADISILAVAEKDLILSITKGKLKEEIKKLNSQIIKKLQKN